MGRRTEHLIAHWVTKLRSPPLSRQVVFFAAYDQEILFSRGNLCHFTFPFRDIRAFATLERHLSPFCTSLFFSLTRSFPRANTTRPPLTSNTILKCWCGDAGYAKNGKADEADCDMACAGDSDEDCGGKNLISVYGSGTTTTPAPATTTPAPASATPAPVSPTPIQEGFIGCYKDDQDNRALDTKKSSSADMTAAVRHSTGVL